MSSAQSVAYFLDKKEGNEVQFQVKGQEYFLAFVEDEGRWYVFSPSAQGLQRMAVYVDVPKQQTAIAVPKGSTTIR